MGPSGGVNVRYILQDCAIAIYTLIGSPTGALITKPGKSGCAKIAKPGFHPFLLCICVRMPSYLRWVLGLLSICKICSEVSFIRISDIWEIQKRRF